MGKLTTHVLDTARGIPAAGVAFSLYRYDAGWASSRHLVAEGRTNKDGRADAPLLDETTLSAGNYCLEFDVEAYLVRNGGEPPTFLGIVPINFRVTDVQRHYHLPLLLSPFGYTTYRGS